MLAKPTVCCTSIQKIQSVKLAVWYADKTKTYIKKDSAEVFRVITGDKLFRKVFTFIFEEKRHTHYSNKNKSTRNFGSCN